jgi:hypothetical protein
MEYQEENKNEKNFLPSKKFILITLSVTAIIAGVLLFFHYNKSGIKIDNLQTRKSVAIRDLIDKDVDGDGIPDWEESLFGTSPYSKDTNNDGISDKEEINAKKKKLGNDGNTEDGSLNDTEKFAQEFFATIISLKESGNLNAETLSQLSTKLGESVGAQKDLDDIYSIEEINKAGPTSKKNLIEYNTQFQKLISKYKGKNMGREVEIVANAMQTGETSGLLDLSTIGKQYEDFAKEFIKIPVPFDIMNLHFRIANDFAKTGIATKTMAEIIDNPLAGLVGVSQYKKYSRNIDNELEELGDYLRKNDILK